MRRVEPLWTIMMYLLGVFVILGLPCIGFAQQAQESVLYTLCSEANCVDGANPHGKLIFDSSGNIYGTAAAGGDDFEGVVFELSPTSNGWAENVLYSFCVNGIQNCPDGANPMAGLVLDRAGNLYGTTQGGGSFGLGTVFELSPPSGQGESWTETVLRSFGGTGDGRGPVSDLVLDFAGRLYGTTAGGGASNGGTVFRLVPHSGGQWSEDILFSFGPGTQGGYGPEAGVTFDKLGNLYGTTLQGGSGGQGLGVVYKLSPKSQLPWKETVLFRFGANSGANPISTVTFDPLGNLYGTVSQCSGFCAGGIFRLMPVGRETSIFFGGAPGPGGPVAGVLIHGASLYGTSFVGGTQDQGTIFQAHGNQSTVLYNFCTEPSCADGAGPSAAVIGRNGSLYGTTVQGGANEGRGVVYQLTSKSIRAQLISAAGVKSRSNRASAAKTSQSH
jgi:uncharacterized repeat protein (TIGR03803 family)